MHYNTEEEISTKFIRLQAALSYTYILEDLENTYLQSGVALSSQNNEAGYFDLLIGVANAGIGYRSDSFSIYLPLKYQPHGSLILNRLFPSQNLFLRYSTCYW